MKHGICITECCWNWSTSGKCFSTGSNGFHFQISKEKHLWPEDAAQHNNNHRQAIQLKVFMPFFVDKPSGRIKLQLQLRAASTNPHVPRILAEIGKTIRQSQRVPANHRLRLKLSAEPHAVSVMFAPLIGCERLYSFDFSLPSKFTRRKSGSEFYANGNAVNFAQQDADDGAIPNSRSQCR